MHAKCPSSYSIIAGAVYSPLGCAVVVADVYLQPNGLCFVVVSAVYSPLGYAAVVV